MNIFQILLISLFQVVFLGKLISKSRLRTLSAFDVVFLLSLDAFLSTFIVRPDFLTKISHFLGIGRGVDVVLYIGLFLLFYLIFRVYYKIEKLRQEITTLNREISIFNAKKEEKKAD